MSNTVHSSVRADLATRVASVTHPCREHVAIEVVADSFPPVDAGQFAQLLCRDDRPFMPRALDWHDGARPTLDALNWDTRYAYLRRPFSFADAWRDPHGAAHLSFISRNIGVGTNWLDHLRPGDTLNITGPLGRGFRVPKGDAPLVLVGGGVGIPPLLLLARQLQEAGRRDVTIIFGAMSRDLFPVELLAEPERDGAASICLRLPGDARFPAIITTDDGTLGFRGRVTDGLGRWHVQAPREKPALVLACGPEPMLAALARQTRELGLACQLCIERQMGCGLGTCLSCVVRVRDASRSAGWRWALSCSEGPVFNRDDLFEYSATS